MDDADPNPFGDDLLVVLRLSNDLMGIAAERQAIRELEHALEAAIAGRPGVGEFDGDEFGGGECTLFFAARNAQELFDLLHPILRRSAACRGAEVVLQAAADGGRVLRRRV
jgi:hypothetical protein